MFFSNIKGFISLLLAVILALFSCACGSEEASTSSEPAVSSVSEVSSETDESAGDITVEYIPSKRDFTYVTDYFSDIPYVGLYNANSLEAYYTESADEHIHPASLTKMVTASVALKYGDVEAVYEVGSELDLVQPHSSLFGLRKGMSLTLRTLLYGLLLPSGNDAAYTIAVNVARGISGDDNLTDTEAVEYFCSLMNDYCAEIGAVNSHFVTPEGWDSEGQYTTVNDLARIAAYAMQNELIAEIVATPEIKLLIDSGETFYLTNSNKLLHEDSEFYDPDVIGVKTGTTDLAGACLVACVSIENRQYIAIAAMCPDDTARFSTVTELIKFAHRYHYASQIGAFNEPSLK